MHAPLLLSQRTHKHMFHYIIPASTQNCALYDPTWLHLSLLSSTQAPYTHATIVPGGIGLCSRLRRDSLRVAQLDLHLVMRGLGGSKTLLNVLNAGLALLQSGSERAHFLVRLLHGARHVVILGLCL